MTGGYMTSKEIIKRLKNDGWYQDRVNGSHYCFRHRVKKGTIVVPHPKKDLPIGTARAILKQAKLI